MGGKDVNDDIDNRWVATRPVLTNITTIWDLKTFLKSSQERLETLKRTSLPNNESMQLERAIINGVSKEIKRLEREVLSCDIFLQ